MVLGIYGAGGSGREIYEMIIREEELSRRWEDIFFIDDAAEGDRRLYNREILLFSDFSEKYRCSEAEILIAVGEPVFRKMLAERVKEKGYRLATVISSGANVSISAEIGEGAVIREGTIVSASARIDSNVYVNGGATIIGHDVHIMDHCQISSLSIVAGRTVVEECVYVGISACIREGLVIGHDSIISMGAVVLKDVRANKIVMGNPAREIAENTSHRVFGG